MSLDGTQAVKELQAELDSRLDALESYSVESELKAEGNLPGLLKVALRNEVEASEIAAYWMHTTPELDIKLGFARQAGDEAKHYRLIEEQLRKMGVDLSGFDPVAQGYSLLFRALMKLDATVSRLAAGQFTREAIAIRRNAMFIRYLEAQGQDEVAALYRDQIQPDETHHHALGAKGLSRLIDSPDKLAQARHAISLTLNLADEMKKAAEQRLGTKVVPGC